MASRTPFTQQQLEDALYEAEVDGDVAIVPSYSGRAMYGETCFGVVHDNGQEGEIAIVIVAAIIETGEEPEDAIRQAFKIVRRARGDNMGRQYITYYPGWELS